MDLVSVGAPHPALRGARLPRARRRRLHEGEPRPIRPPGARLHDSSDDLRVLIGELDRRPSTCAVSGCWRAREPRGPSTCRRRRGLRARARARDRASPCGRWRPPSRSSAPRPRAVPAATRRGDRTSCPAVGRARARRRRSESPAVSSAELVDALGRCRPEVDHVVGASRDPETAPLQVLRRSGSPIAGASG